MKAGDFLKKIKEKKHQDKLDVLLIHCDLFYEMEFSSGSMGMVYIATNLVNEGYKTDIIGTPQLYNWSLNKTGREIKRKNPSIIGFYTISDNFEQVLDFAEKIKTWLPNTKIIAGGPLAAALEDEMLSHKCFDMVCVGEGEHLMVKLCDVLIKNKGNIKDIEGLIYRENDKIIKTRPANPIENLDSLPFPHEKFFKGQQVFQVVSGRGCPYKCTFCFQAGHGLTFRFRSAENVTKEITGLLDRYPFVGFDFIDDAFIMNPQRCREIAESLKEYREKTRRDFIFFCQGRVNIIDKHPDLIPLLVDAGLAKMQLGIESGDPEVLKLYKKGITLDQVRRTVKTIYETQSLIAVGGFILGGPFENEKTFIGTLDLALELIEEAPGVFESSAGFLGAYPGTEIAGNPEKFGLNVLERDFIKGFSLSDVQMTTQYLDVNQIRDLKRRFQAKTFEAMSKNIHRIPRKLLAKHYRWAERYKIYSSWYLYFLAQLNCVKNYFKFLESPRFKSFRQVHPDDLMRWKPMRIVESRDYTPDGSLILPASIQSGILKTPEEILAYELCSGKLTVKEAVKRFCEDRNIKGNENEVFENIFIPLFNQLDNTYRIVFYE